MSQTQLNTNVTTGSTNDTEEMAAELLDEIEHTPAVDAVLDTFDFDQLVQDISAYGKRLRSNKPDADGLTQYVWRMAKYHSSKTDSRPVMADMWLSTYIEDNTSLDISRRSEEFETIEDALQLVEMAAAIELGHDPTTHARRMEGVLY